LHHLEHGLRALAAAALRLRFLEKVLDEEDGGGFSTARQPR
jgi:hypothetical protein